MTQQSMTVDMSKYKKLSDIEHVLERSAIYIGSLEFKTEQELEVFDDNAYFEKVDDSGKVHKEFRPIHRRYDATLCSSLITLFNELITNSFDERTRCINERRKYLVNKIVITVNPYTGMISCFDNGGIPVVKHTEYDEWIPQMLLGSLRAGSNFNDEERQDVAGLNGVGSSLVNVMSTKFKVTTALNGKQFEMTWCNNMREHSDAIISDTEVDNHFTLIEAWLDMKRWQINGMPMQMIPIDIVAKWMSRCIEVAVMGCHAKPDKALEVTWQLQNAEGEVSYERTFKFAHLWEYKDLWQGTETWRGDENEHYAFEVGPSVHGQFESFALVNSIRCDYGKHMDFIANVVADAIIAHVKWRHKFEVKKKDVLKHLSIISMWRIPAPDFESQTKDYLATPTDKFGFPINISEKLKQHICNSTDIVQRIVDEHNAKQLVEEAKAKRAEKKFVNESLKVKTKQFHVQKLVDASQKGDRSNCELFIVEGDSASQGLRQFRDAYTQGFYCMRGKSVGNCFYMSEAQMVKKQELLGLTQSIGLKFGEYADKSKLRYGRICLMTDADVDGDCISALISLFFYKNWPELYDQHLIYHVMTPIVIATKHDKRGNIIDTKRFYVQEEFDKVEEELVKDGYDCQYKKGLAALTMEEFAHCMENPMYEEFVIEKDANGDMKPTWNAYETWFSNDSNARKKQMVGFE